MIKRAIFCIAILFISVPLHAQLQSPSEFLGYEIGSEWTPHYKVMDYFRHAAAESDMVTFQEYGQTYEGRELNYAVVTSKANHTDLEEIRVNNLRRTGLEPGELSGNTKPIVWLSYNVHGNETSSSEAAMNTLYRLLTEKSNWLNDVVVIMDPMINPDGRDRYVNWYRSVAGKFVNPDLDAREHREPWPGGRTNHYYFDLNRDWAWQTQIESQHRIRLYNKWMPQVHVDFHEQYINSPYYFAPAAEPFHKAITDWQREFQTMIGKNHTSYFDEEGWLYFTREVFDLFYPSYGDTWPTFNGAIGMTYEQAGHGLAGLAAVTAEGDTLTLNDRMTHHTITGLSTVEITAKNAERVLQEFTNYFEKAQNDPSGRYKNFVVSKSTNPDKLGRLIRYLRDQEIEYAMAAKNSAENGFDYRTGDSGRLQIQKGDLVVPAAQPKGRLVRVLYEPKPELADSITYDLTAWEMHYAMGLDGYALTSDIETTPFEMPVDPNLSPYIEKPYAYLMEWKSLDDLKYLAALLQEGLIARYAEKPFRIDGRDFAAGTMIITRNGNENWGDTFDEKVKSMAEQFGRVLIPVATGFVESGADFGSSSVHYVDAPKVALLSGEGTSSGDVGHIWHYFDRQINYPITMINLDDAGSVQWSDYDVMILPGGRYSNVFDESGMSELLSWVRSGGTLIAVESANSFFSGKDGFGLKRKETDKEERSGDDLLRTYGDSERESAGNLNTGSVFELTMDATHPLAFGYGEQYFSLRTGSSGYSYLENGWNVGVAKENSLRSGFVGHKAINMLENSLSFGVEPMGSGEVVYMIDNPLYRGFWHNGKLLFGNAVFLLSSN